MKKVFFKIITVVLLVLSTSCKKTEIAQMNQIQHFIYLLPCNWNLTHNYGNPELTLYIKNSIHYHSSNLNYYFDTIPSAIYYIDLKNLALDGPVRFNKYFKVQSNDTIFFSTKENLNYNAISFDLYYDEKKVKTSNSSNNYTYIEYIIP